MAGVSLPTWTAQLLCCEKKKSPIISVEINRCELEGKIWLCDIIEGRLAGFKSGTASKHRGWCKKWTRFVSLHKGNTRNRSSLTPSLIKNHHFLSPCSLFGVKQVCRSPRDPKLIWDKHNSAAVSCWSLNCSCQVFQALALHRCLKSRRLPRFFGRTRLHLRVFPSARVDTDWIFHLWGELYCNTPGGDGRAGNQAAETESRPEMTTSQLMSSQGYILVVVCPVRCVVGIKAAERVHLTNLNRILKVQHAEE